MDDDEVGDDDNDDDDDDDDDNNNNNNNNNNIWHGEKMQHLEKRKTYKYLQTAQSEATQHKDWKKNTMEN